MSDYQRKRVIAAEDATWASDLNTVLDFSGTVTLVNEICRAHDLAELTVIEVASTRRLVLKDGELHVPPWAMRPLGVAHALAHTLVHPIFPAHGAEFVETLIDIVERHVSPGLAELLVSEFDKQRVHRDAEVRRRRTRRAIVYAANNERGVLVELLLADPPERVVGALQGITTDGNVTVGEQTVELTRGRYLNVVRG